MQRLMLITFAAFAGMACAQTTPTWVTMVDPQEHAFSIDVPQGWKAYGGMFRSNAVEVKPFIDMTSPDGEVNLRVGDASIPSYELPNPRLQGLRQRYSRTASRQFVAPYASGDQFAARYGQSRFGSICQNLQISKTGQSEPTFGRGTNGTRITDRKSVV